MTNRPRGGDEVGEPLGAQGVWPLLEMLTLSTDLVQRERFTGVGGGGGREAAGGSIKKIKI